AIERSVAKNTHYYVSAYGTIGDGTAGCGEKRSARFSPRAAGFVSGWRCFLPGSNTSSGAIQV
ncbi:MAG TPA: hypothetical protein PLF25_11740, partial [Accumulibacter sp.]|nr:hypothetical protein [Accumulibacter sp.]